MTILEQAKAIIPECVNVNTRGSIMGVVHDIEQYSTRDDVKPEMMDYMTKLLESLVEQARGEIAAESEDE